MPCGGCTAAIGLFRPGFRELLRSDGGTNGRNTEEFYTQVAGDEGRCWI